MLSAHMAEFIRGKIAILQKSTTKKTIPFAGRTVFIFGCYDGIFFGKKR
jgi:hypothetical protein